MKCVNYFIAVVAIVAVGSLTSCMGHSPETISKGDIVDAYNEMLESKAENVITTELMLGTFECNDENEREMYRKLEAAGIVNYDVERLAWWEKGLKKVKKYRTVTDWYGWYSYNRQEPYWTNETAYDFEDHYIVTVSLTPKGERIVIKENPQPAVDKDMEQPEIDYSKYAWNNADLSENWPYIENPFLKKEVVEETSPETVEDSVVRDDEEPVETPKDETPNVVRIDAAQYKKYQAFSGDGHYAVLLAGKVEAETARFIQIMKSENGISRARAEVIVETVDVTDIGRIQYGMENGIKRKEEVTLTYYLDKGWVLDEE